MNPLTAEVAVIGAGTAGCFAANLLDEAGIECLLIEKSRGIGGRCSRRRIAREDGNHFGIDLGAPEFSLRKASHPLLKEKIEAWVKQGYLSTWTKRASHFDGHKNDIKIRASHCGSPAMSSWHNKVAGHINILTQSKVKKIERSSNQWSLYDEEHQLLAVTRQLIITSPPEQAIDLLNTVDGFSYSEKLPIESLPQYVCAIGFQRPLNLQADAYESGHGVLFRAVRENSKPDRNCPNPLQEIWVLHSTHEWAHEQHHADSQIAAVKLTQSFCQHFGVKMEPHALTSHYWRMARHKPVTQAHQPFIWDKTLKVGCCGDWLASGGTVGALNSALALHQTIMGGVRTTR